MVGPLAVAVEPPAVELEQGCREQHAPCCKSKAGPPAYGICQERTEKLREKRAEIDAHVEDGETGITAAIALQERRHQVLLLERRGILGGLAAGRWFPDLDDVLVFCCTELNDPAALQELVAAVRTGTKVLAPAR
jgi:hypothetical protein